MGTICPGLICAYFPLSIPLDDFPYVVPIFLCSYFSSCPPIFVPPFLRSTYDHSGDDRRFGNLQFSFNRAILPALLVFLLYLFFEPPLFTLSLMALIQKNVGKGPTKMTKKVSQSQLCWQGVLAFCLFSATVLFAAGFFPFLANAVMSTRE